MKLLLTALALLLAADLVATAGDLIPWQDADGHVGEERTVEGKVVAARREGNVLRIMFDADPSSFSVALISSLLSPLPADPAAVYEGRTIRATGRIRSFHGIAEMMIRDSSQIALIPIEAEPLPTAGVGLEKRVEELENRVERLERRLKK